MPFQIPAVRPVHQNPEALYLRQDVNHRIDTKRCGNALPPNHPYLQVREEVPIIFLTPLLSFSVIEPRFFCFMCIIGLCTYGLKEYNTLTTAARTVQE